MTLCWVSVCAIHLLQLYSRHPENVAGVVYFRQTLSFPNSCSQDRNCNRVLAADICAMFYATISSSFTSSAANGLVQQELPRQTLRKAMHATSAGQHQGIRLVAPFAADDRRTLAFVGCQCHIVLSQTYCQIGADTRS